MRERADTSTGIYRQGKKAVEKMAGHLGIAKGKFLTQLVLKIESAGEEVWRILGTPGSARIDATVLRKIAAGLEKSERTKKQ